MKKVIAKKDFKLNGVNYIEGDEIETKDIQLINKLNEEGLIEPLTYRDLVLLERELKEEKEEL